VNALRGHLAELGIIRARGLNKVSELMRLIDDAADDGLPAKIRGQLRHLVEPLRDLQHCLAEIDREHPAARRLATIPGVGPVTATALAAVMGDIGRFRSGRHLAAYLGLVPLQHSSGGKERLGVISQRGDAYLRTLLMHGARAVVRIMKARRISGRLDRPPAAATAGQHGGGGAGQQDGADRLGRAGQGGG
jgi:transposase